MAMPEDEDSWGDLCLMFATSSGGVRRNRLSDFVSINRNGKIAMKLDEGDSLIGVSTCTEDKDVLLATHLGMSIRFPVTDVRIFSGRTSTGVRGIKLGDDDRVISMTMLKHSEATAEERRAFLKRANALRQAEGEDSDGADEIDSDEIEISQERFDQLAEEEDFILTISEQGFGKRSSSHGYRLTGRGGKGIWNMEMGDKNQAIAASFPVADGDEIFLVTDGGQIIRTPIDDVRIAARKTMGVTLFDIEEGARVVSVARVREDDEDEADEEDQEGEDEEGEGVEDAPDGDE